MLGEQTETKRMDPVTSQPDYLTHNSNGNRQPLKYRGCLQDCLETDNPLSLKTFHSFIQQYLIKRGYGDTAKAFAAEVQPSGLFAIDKASRGTSSHGLLFDCFAIMDAILGQEIDRPTGSADQMSLSSPNQRDGHQHSHQQNGREGLFVSPELVRLGNGCNEAVWPCSDSTAAVSPHWQWPWTAPHGPSPWTPDAIALAHLPEQPPQRSMSAVVRSSADGEPQALARSLSIQEASSDDAMSHLGSLGNATKTKRRKRTASAAQGVKSTSPTSRTGVRRGSTARYKANSQDMQTVLPAVPMFRNFEAPPAPSTTSTQQSQRIEANDLSMSSSDLTLNTILAGSELLQPHLASSLHSSEAADISDTSTSLSGGRLAFGHRVSDASTGLYFSGGSLRHDATQSALWMSPPRSQGPGSDNAIALTSALSLPSYSMQSEPARHPSSLWPSNVPGFQGVPSRPVMSQSVGQPLGDPWVRENTIDRPTVMASPEEIPMLALSVDSLPTFPMVSGTSQHMVPDAELRASRWTNPSKGSLDPDFQSLLQNLRPDELVEMALHASSHDAPEPSSAPFGNSTSLQRAAGQQTLADRQIQALGPASSVEETSHLVRTQWRPIQSSTAVESITKRDPTHSTDATATAWHIASQMEDISAWYPAHQTSAPHTFRVHSFSPCGQTSDPRVTTAEVPRLHQPTNARHTTQVGECTSADMTDRRLGSSSLVSNASESAPAFPCDPATSGPEAGWQAAATASLPLLADTIWIPQQQDQSAALSSAPCSLMQLFEQSLPSQDPHEGGQQLQQPQAQQIGQQPFQQTGADGGNVSSAHEPLRTSGGIDPDLAEKMQRSRDAQLSAMRNLTTWYDRHDKNTSGGNFGSPMFGHGLDVEEGSDSQQLGTMFQQ